MLVSISIHLTAFLAEISLLDGPPHSVARQMTSTAEVRQLRLRLTWPLRQTFIADEPLLDTITQKPIVLAGLPSLTATQRAP